MILHVLDDGPEATSLQLWRMRIAVEADRAAGRSVGVLLIGGGRLTEAARRADLRWDRRLGLPLGQALLAPTSGRRAFQAEPPVEAVVAWSVGALSAATTLSPSVPRELMVLLPPGNDAARRRLGRLMSSGGFDLICPTAWLAKAYADAGLPTGRIRERRLPPSPQGLPTPPVTDPAAPIVLATLADPPWACDANNLAMATCLAEETSGRSLVCLVHPAAHRHLEARHLLAAVQRSGNLLFDAIIGGPDGLLAAISGARIGPRVEAAVLPGPPSPVSASFVPRWLPVIAVAHPAHEEALADHPTVFWSRTSNARHLSHQLCRLTEQLRDTSDTGATATSHRHNRAAS